MPYITREDGERFVIPSYRDVLRAKKATLLKREIMLLASNYGDYATIQKKSKTEFEVAFSPDSGYLLGETVWAYFNRPRDLIYCEVIPDTNEAILVIVKGGSVYLDGSFPIDSISEELVIFKTQKNEFDIYIYGDVPISQTFEEGKISFDANSVHSFNVLPEPIFQTLPIIKAFQLQLIDVILKSQGIGVFPLKPLLLFVGLLAIVWAIWEVISTHKVELPPSFISVVNPYQVYVSTLTSPSPDKEVQVLVDQITQLLTIPGWFPSSITYKEGALQASLKSNGARTDTLFKWADNNKADVSIQPNGIYITLNAKLNDRPPPSTISKIRDVIASLIDRLSYVIPGNPLQIGVYENKGQYIQSSLTIDFTDISLTTLALMGKQFKGLPLVLTNAQITMNDGFASGSLALIVLGK
jgi:hypothetical protein